MTAKFDYYRLRELNAEDASRNAEGTWIAEVDDDVRPTGRRMTFDCRSVPHVTLRSIARNTSLDPILRAARTDRRRCAGGAESAHWGRLTRR